MDVVTPYGVTCCNSNCACAKINTIIIQSGRARRMYTRSTEHIIKNGWTPQSRYRSRHGVDRTTGDLVGR